MRLLDKVVLVTGAGQGIGRASAVRFAEEGAAVVCVDIAADLARRTATQIEEAGGQAVPVAADISTPQGNSDSVETALEAFGGLDVFHANAAIQIMGKLDEMPTADWDRLHDTNLRGVYIGLATAIPRMEERGGGSIIITASVLGIVGDPDLPAYGAMKGGLRAMCRSLAAAHGPQNIRVNTICPGDVETPLLKDYFDHQPKPDTLRAEMTQRYPLRRFATPLDVANVAVFLASEDAAYLTGIDIIVDGGLLARIY